MIAAVTIGVPAIAFADRTPTNDKTFQYAIGLWGDLPYSAVQADPGIPNLVADMNSQELSFSVHDGDLKGGNGPTANPPSVTCDDTLYTQALGYLNLLDAPAMFTPGSIPSSDSTTSAKCSSARRRRSAVGHCTKKCKTTRRASAT